MAEEIETELQKLEQLKTTYFQVKKLLTDIRDAIQLYARENSQNSDQRELARYKALIDQHLNTLSFGTAEELETFLRSKFANLDEILSKMQSPLVFVRDNNLYIAEICDTAELPTYNSIQEAKDKNPNLQLHTYKSYGHLLEFLSLPEHLTRACQEIENLKNKTFESLCPPIDARQGTLYANSKPKQTSTAVRLTNLIRTMLSLQPIQQPAPQISLLGFQSSLKDGEDLYGTPPFKTRFVAIASLSST